MRISDKALNAIKESTRLKNLLALAMDCSVYTIDRWIKEGGDNLTKATALKIIREETGLSDSDLLEEQIAIAK